jgi:hypothetical protein
LEINVHFDGRGDVYIRMRNSDYCPTTRRPSDFRPGNYYM